MGRTPTLPPTDAGMWRRLMARAHPDAGGAHELFIWAGRVKELVCSDELQTSRRQAHESPRKGSVECIPFDPYADFEVLTSRAVAMASAVAEPYAYLLRRLADCHPVSDGPLLDQQRRGASYRALAAIGHKVEMSKAERVQWYRIAEAIPLSQRHVLHILSHLERPAA